jgi:hypothetical protein
MNNFRKLDRLIRPFLRADRFMLAKVLMVLAIIVMAPGGLSRAACTWCAAWHNEVGVIYDKTPESKVLPLRRVDVDGERPADLGHLGGIRFTPTFVILEDGAEIGRILGYPGEDFFWQLLGEIVKKVESKHANKS